MKWENIKLLFAFDAFVLAVILSFWWIKPSNKTINAIRSNNNGDTCETASLLIDQIQIEANKSMMDIPKSEQYFTTLEGKILLDLNLNKCGTVYFRSKNSIGIIDDGLIVGFIKDFPKEMIYQIISNEKLDGQEMSDYQGKVMMSIKTSPNSKYIDALRMGNYLFNKYDTIQFAEPDIMSVSGIKEEKGEEIKIIPIPDQENLNLIRDKSFYVEGVGVINPKPGQQFVKEWGQLVDDSSKTLKQYIDMVISGYKLDPNDTQVVNYALGETNLDGTSPDLLLLLYSKSQKKFYRFNFNGFTRMDAKVGEENTITRPLDISQVIDSPEMVKLAVQKKGECKDKIQMMYFGSFESSSGKVDVSCYNGWGTMMDPMK